MRIAMEAATHMSDSGISDYSLAKRKACQKLGVVDSRNLPSNQEIKDALFEYQSQAQVLGGCPAHGNIVDGAVDSQISDTAAGKKNRIHYESISRKGQPLPIDIQDGTIMQLSEDGVI